MNGLSTTAWRSSLRRRLYWALYEVGFGYWIALAVVIGFAIIWRTA